MLIVDFYVICISLLFGSFFNVVAIRLLKKESISYPPSHCVYCKHRLGVLDLIPLVSFVFLQGRCRYCHATISRIYPFGELLTAISIFAVYKEVGFSLELIPALLLTIVLLLAVLTDIREKLILDVITIPSMILLLICRLFIGEEPFLFYILGGLTGFGLLYFIAVVSKGGMGGGDIKLFAAIGVAVGPVITVMSLVLASFFGSVIGLFLIAYQKMHKKDPIAFGPFILLGTLLSYLYGADIWEWYTSLLRL